MHGTVNESSLEQRFCKSDVITFVVWKIWWVLWQASRQSDKILVDLKFSTDCIGKIFVMFNEGTVLL